MTEEQLDEIVHKQFINRVTPYEKAFIAAVMKYDVLAKEQVLSNLDTLEKGMRRKTALNVIIKELLDTDRAKEMFVGLTIPVLQELMQTEGTAQAERLNTTDPFNPNNAEIQERLNNMLEMTAVSYTDTTLKLLNNTLADGIAAGESMAKLTQRVADVFELSSDYRAEAVERTTVFSAANASAREAYRQSGVVKEVKWHTAEDEVVCEYCGPMNGKTVGIDETFFDEGDNVQGADGHTMTANFGDIIDPPLHMNCRCFTNAVVSRKDNENTPSEEKDADHESETDTFLKDILTALDYETEITKN